MASRVVHVCQLSEPLVSTRNVVHWEEGYRQRRWCDRQVELDRMNALWVYPISLQNPGLWIGLGLQQRR